ncbi:hypothetical protein [Vulcanisaeta sp. JCM 16161]|uniref:hypothetical protein n=1 Tax=Vulcanisaeta sp. JCM 16161 TaxID=1295372 RepID=UPI000A54DB6D|nr:hypothetical protein [Vulcanisaeta sp. JCM 16161]
MISDYMKGGFKLVVEKNRLKAISDSVKAIEEEFGVKVMVDNDKGEVTIIPGVNTNFDQLMKLRISLRPFHTALTIMTLKT